MIKRLYVDNFKCFVKFDYRPTSLQLMFGENGTGKTAAFEVLEKLRDCVVTGVQVAQLFPASALTRWEDRSEQTFELQIEANGESYIYSLVVEHDRSAGKNRIEKEELWCGGGRLYVFDGQNAHLFSDSGLEGPVFPHDWSRSALSSIPERNDNQKLSRFRERMARVYVFAIDPLRMAGLTDAEELHPDRRLANFASWYRHLAQESPELMASLLESLHEVVNGLTTVKLVVAGETTRSLRVGFEHSSRDSANLPEFFLTFDQLSEGQRCLIALFTVLRFAVRPETTICIDEPDNFVALRELQPWLLELADRVAEEGAQCLLVSHHPEFINQLAVPHGICFNRERSADVQPKPFTWSKEDGILPSDVVARGWED